MRIAVLGIDLAKSIFHLYGVDERGRRVLSQRVSRAKLATIVANLPPCVIGMEACSTSHHWARRFGALGHEVRLIHPNFVRPYVKGNKNDELDAEAICEAASRPNMRFVPVKTVEQQDVQALHRARERLVRWRTALINQIRGIMGERGIVFAQGARRVGLGLQDAIADHTNELTGLSRGLLATLADELAGLEARLHELDQQLVALCRQSELCRRVSSVPGIGPVIATALVASIGDGRQFKNGRELAAWIGLVPRQRSSGGKIRLVGIGKRAHRYLRNLLIHGGRAVLRFARGKTDPRSRWLSGLEARRGRNCAIIGQANKTARIAWAVLARGEPFQVAA
jgi:transposase